MQFVDELLHAVVIVFSAFALFADIAVGADGEAVQRHIALLRPFGERLRKQGKARHKKQHTFAFARQLFGDFQGSKGFARAARHDQLATVGIVQAMFDGFECGLLVRAQLFFGTDDGCLLECVLRPVDDAVFKMAAVDDVDGRVLVAE